MSDVSKDEVLMKCESTFFHIERIIKILKESDPEERPELIQSIDIDFKNIRDQINKAIMSPEKI
jgi:hypothetical protein